MITTLPFLVFLGSVKWKGTEEVPTQWKPTRQDVLALRAELAKYQPKVINEKKQYAREQDLVAKGICSFGDHGELQIVSPQMYQQAEETYGLHQWMQEKDQEQLFQAYPEEKVAWEQKIAGMFASTRALTKTA